MIKPKQYQYTGQNSLPAFHHNAVNDLAFAIFAPSMLCADNNFHVELNTQRKQWLEKLDSNPQTLLDTCSTDQRLGHYYEALWGFFFKHDEQYMLIAQNLQVFNGKQTIGEFDFIIKDHHHNQFLHLEVAAKYYLFFGNNSLDKKQWPGPNSQDNLGKKFNNLSTKQSQLSTTDEGKKALAKLIGQHIIKPVINLKGYLFCQQAITASLPDIINPAQKLNHYFYPDQLNDTDVILHIPKSRWLSTAHEADSCEEVSIKQAKAMVAERNSPLLFANAVLDNNVWIEQQRFFICPKLWPDNYPT